MPNETQSQLIYTFPGALPISGNSQTSSANCAQSSIPIKLNIGTLNIATLNIETCCDDDSSCGCDNGGGGDDGGNGGGGGFPTEPEDPNNPGGDSACGCIVREDPADPD